MAFAILREESEVRIVAGPNSMSQLPSWAPNQGTACQSLPAYVGGRWVFSNPRSWQRVAVESEKTAVEESSGDVCGASVDFVGRCGALAKLDEGLFRLILV